MRSGNFERILPSSHPKNYLRFFEVTVRVFCFCFLSLCSVVLCGGEGGDKNVIIRIQGDGYLIQSKHLFKKVGQSKGVQVRTGGDRAGRR